jgi:YQGE family putative transporter
MKAVRRLLLMNGLFALGNGLSGLFTGVYLFRLRPGVVTPAFYGLWSAVALLVAMPVLGAWVKRWGAVFISVLGTTLYAAFYLALLLLQERAADHLTALGLFMGVAVAANALAGHVLVYDVTEPEQREAVLAHNGLVGAMAGLAAPPAAGWLVSAFPGLAGYRLIFLASFAFFAASAWAGLGLRSRRPPEPYRIREVLPGPDRGWRWLLASYGALGLRDGIFGFAVNLLVYLSGGGEGRLGRFAFLTSLVGMATFWLAGRVMTPQRRTRFFVAGAWAMALGSGLLMLGTTWPVMLAHGLVSALANPFWSSAFGAASFDVIRTASGSRDLRVEMIAAREIPLNLGRVATLLLFLSVAPYLDHPGVLQILLAGLGLAFPVALTCTQKALRLSSTK